MGEETVDSVTGDQRFYDLLLELAEVHAKKSHDYGLSNGETGEAHEDFLEADPLFNFRGSILWGVEPWVGAMVRIGDKMSRLQTHSAGHQLSNESVRDTLLDAASYCLIALILYEEEDGTGEDEDELDE